MFDMSRHGEYRGVLSEIYDAVTLDALGGESRASAELYGLLVLLNAVLNGGGRRTVQQNPAMEAIIAYIDENYTNDITLDQLCRAAGGLSEQYLCRLFKQSTGMRPMEYMLRRRISAARTYLERSDMTIAEVAIASGFRNTSYFYRSFRKLTGKSPLVYRQYVLGAEDDPQLP
jgi:AraC-like DNA-binding protein